MKRATAVILGLLILAAGAYALWWLIHLTWSTLSALDMSIFAALVTGSLVATGAIWVKHLEHRHSVEAGFRDQKINHFNDFLLIFEDITANDVQPDATVQRLKEWKRVAQLWGGPKVVRSLFSLINQAAARPETIGALAKMMEPMGAMCLAMRKDLGLSSARIVPVGHRSSISKATVFGVYCQLRHPEMFLKCLAKDPNMSSEDYHKLEAQANLDAGI